MESIEELNEELELTHDIYLAKRFLYYYKNGTIDQIEAAYQEYENYIDTREFLGAEINEIFRDLVESAYRRLSE